jgi:putative peptide zinc metalloprotease protein
LAALFWRVTICVSLAILATALFYGFGIALAIIGVIFWLGTPIWRFVSNWQDPSAGRKPNFKWIATVTVPAIACLALVMFSFPWPVRVSAPAIVEYESPALIRADASGFVKAVYVTEGQTVRRGDLLVELENPELELELRSLLIDIRISEIRCNALLSREMLGELVLEQESLDSMQKRQYELEEQISNLQIVASESGTVIASDLHAEEGQYFRPGDEILTIGNPEEIHAIALTRQQDVKWIEKNPNADIELRIWGRSENASITGRIKDINPRARDDLPHEAFAATAGGPLPVVPRDQVEGSSEEDEMMLTEPRVSLEIAFEQIDRAGLLPGQSGQLIIRERNQSIGAYLAQNFTQFVKKNNLRTHGL